MEIRSGDAAFRYNQPACPAFLWIGSFVGLAGSTEKLLLICVCVMGRVSKSWFNKLQLGVSCVQFAIHNSHVSDGGV